MYGFAARGLLAVLVRLPYGALRPTLSALTQPILWWSFRAKIDRHLQLALPELSNGERKATAGAVVRNTALVAPECLGFAAQGPLFLRKRCDDAAAREMLEGFRREWDGGWIGVTGHLGNWELMGQWLACHPDLDYAGSVARRTSNPHLARVVDDVRGRHGMRTLYREDSSSQLVRQLRAGKVVGMVPDQDVAAIGGVFIDVFGRPAYTPVGPARLSLAAGVPIVVGAMLRRDNGFEVVVSAPIHPDRRAPRNQEILRLTRAWSADIEAIIRSEPAQWAWFHDRWRTTPARLEARQRQRLEL